MNKLKIQLQHCYGIKKLEYEFDFSECKTFVVYAPNGAMKTSFAKTFKDIGGDQKPCDQMDDSQTSVYDISVDNSGNQIAPEEICVIEPYNEKAFGSEEKVLALLANEEIRKEYLDIYTELDLAKQSLIKNLKRISKSTNCETELIATFSVSDKSIYEIFSSIIERIKKTQESFNFKYNDVFDAKGKVQAFLSENQTLFKEYCNKYADLISESDFFARGKNYAFGTTEAKNIKASIDGNEFFIAGHKLNLKKYGDIDNKDRFVEIVNEEINEVFNDENLKQVFEKIDKKLDANEDLKAFKKVIEKEPSLLIRLDDYKLFREEVWFSYLNQTLADVETLVSLYLDKKQKLDAVVKKANDQKSKWEEAIEEFHNRFVNLPFTLAIDNKTDAILNTLTPALSFKFDGKPVDRKKLLDVLSQGEKRAFYLLNIIFEIRAREMNNQKTLFVIDDVAESFDYKNKYAIVEYLNDLTKSSNFYSLILTHNFDFFRTITSRLGLPRKNKLHAIKKTNLEIEIIAEVYQKPPFITWRENMKSGQYHDKYYTNIDAKKHIIALIPFVRNLIEYSGCEHSSTSYGNDFDVLTSLLHSKSDTKRIAFGDLKQIFNKCLNNDDFDSSILTSDPVYNVIIDLAAGIVDNEFNLENKIILAMAIRHVAEEYMLSKVTDTTLINGSQTGELFRRYKKQFKDDANHKEKIRILESVNIMTPENIHLNSFMYEPILDLGIDELRSLHYKVCDLTSD